MIELNIFFIKSYIYNYLQKNGKMLVKVSHLIVFINSFVKIKYMIHEHSYKILCVFARMELSKSSFDCVMLKRSRGFKSQHLKYNRVWSVIRLKNVAMKHHHQDICIRYYLLGRM